MKTFLTLAFSISLFFFAVVASADSIGRNLQPSAELTFLPPNVTLGNSDGTWCEVKITSESNQLSGLGSYLFTQVDDSGVISGAPLIGAVQVAKAYKFILSGDELVVEVRDKLQRGKLLCTLSGNQKKISVKGTWIWPTNGSPFAGADFCDQGQAPTANQRMEAATLEVNCSK